MGSIVLETYPMIDALDSVRKLVMINDYRYISTHSVVDYAEEMLRQGKPIPQYQNYDEAKHTVDVHIDTLKKINPEIMLADINTIELHKHEFKNFMYWGSTDELTPESRVEWLELMGVIVGKIDKGVELASNITKLYNATKNFIPNIRSKNYKIFLGTLYKYVDKNKVEHEGWLIPGGNSYKAKIIADINSTYLYAHNSNTSDVMISFDEGYNLLKEADYWIAPDLCFSKLEEFIGHDHRLAKVNCVVKGNILLASRRTDDDLCYKNEARESGILYPKYVLTDLALLLYGNHSHLYDYHAQYYTYVLPLLPGNKIDFDNENTYPVNCQYQGWRDWNECSADCGLGVQFRRRDIKSLPLNGGAQCNQMFDVQECYGPCHAKVNLTVLIICLVVIGVVICIVLAWYCGKKTAKNIGFTLSGLHPEERDVVIENLAQGNYQTLA